MNLHKIRVLLEVNDVSFKYYLGLYLVLLVLDIWKEGFVFRVLRFPLSWLMWFVIVSGILKLFFNLDRVISQFRRFNFWGAKEILGFLLFLKSAENYFSYLFQEFKKSVNSIFSWSLIFYLALLLIGEFKNTRFTKELLSFNYNPVRWFLSGRMNWLLGWVILTGLFSIFWGEQQEKKTEEKITKKDYLFIFGLGIFGAYLIFYKTKELGWLSYVISSISGLLIILLSFIILGEEDEPSNRDN